MPIIKLPDGNNINFPNKVTGLEIAEKISKSLSKQAMIISVDNELKDLSYSINKNSSVKIFTSKDNEGLETIRHDTAHILAMAVQELFPGTQVTIGPVIENGFYYDFARKESFTEEDLNKIVESLNNKGIIKNFNMNNINIDYSSKSKQGDLSTNIFLVLNKLNLDKNFDLKKYIFNFLSDLEYIDRIEIAKVGFINIFLKKKFLIIKLKNFINKLDKFTNSNQINKNINIEFVSANPTGPIHIAHMRGAVLGDVLASILESVGHKITKEYYVNDAGSQIVVLGKSLYKRYQQLFKIDVELLEGEYPGEYLNDIAREIKNIDNDKWLNYKDDEKKDKYFKDYAVKVIVQQIKKDLSLINISFDKFTYESDIVKNNYIDTVFSLLKKATYPTTKAELLSAISNTIEFGSISFFILSDCLINSLYEIDSFSFIKAILFCGVNFFLKRLVIFKHSSALYKINFAINVYIII